MRTGERGTPERALKVGDPQPAAASGDTFGETEGGQDGSGGGRAGEVDGVHRRAQGRSRGVEARPAAPRGRLLGDIPPSPSPMRSAATSGNPLFYWLFSLSAKLGAPGRTARGYLNQGSSKGWDTLLAHCFLRPSTSQCPTSVGRSEQVCCVERCPLSEARQTAIQSRSRSADDPKRTCWLLSAMPATHPRWTRVPRHDTAFDCIIDCSRFQRGQSLRNGQRDDRPRRKKAALAGGPPSTRAGSAYR